jgi:hypothetical protein
LKALIGTAKPNDKFKKPTVIPSILGYKGVIVDNPNKISGLPAFLAVYRGDIEVKDEFKKFLVDEGASVENLLLNEAMRKGVIDERILKSIKPD